MDFFQKCYDYRDADMAREMGIYPYFVPIEESSGTEVVIKGKKVLMVCSNNYLGLTHDPRVKEAAINAIKRFGTSGCGSRLANGNFILHNELDERLARFIGKPAALVYPAGFLANAGSISCLIDSNDMVFSDEDNHSSIIAGCRLGRGRVIRYAHNDSNDLAAKVKENSAKGGALIVADGVFSMAGTIVDLPGLVKVKRDNPPMRLYIDEAHGIGVLGKDGRGTTNHFGLTDEVDLIMGTFSKTFASVGGFVAGPKEVINFMQHRSSGEIFSAAATPASVAAILKVLDIIETEPEHVERLRKNMRKMREAFESLNINFIPSDTAILCIRVGDEFKTCRLVMELLERGLFTTPVVYPVVPQGQGLIRTAYMATHTEEQLNFALDLIREFAPKYGLFRQ